MYILVIKTSASDHNFTIGASQLISRTLYLLRPMMTFYSYGSTTTGGAKLVQPQLPRHRLEAEWLPMAPCDQHIHSHSQPNVGKMCCPRTETGWDIKSPKLQLLDGPSYRPEEQKSPRVSNATETITEQLSAEKESLQILVALFPLVSPDRWTRRHLFYLKARWCESFFSL